MRTTLTIDDDLAGILKRRSQELGVSFKEIVNLTLRAGIGDQARPPQDEIPATISHSFGFRSGIDLDKLNRLADELEDESYVAAQRSQPRSQQATRHDPARRKRSRSRP